MPFINLSLQKILKYRNWKLVGIFVFCIHLLPLPVFGDFSTQTSNVPSLVKAVEVLNAQSPNVRSAELFTKTAPDGLRKIIVIALDSTESDSLDESQAALLRNFDIYVVDKDSEKFLSLIGESVPAPVNLDAGTSHSTSLILQNRRLERIVRAPLTLIALYTQGRYIVNYMSDNREPIVYGPKIEGGLDLLGLYLVSTDLAELVHGIRLDVVSENDNGSKKKNFRKIVTYAILRTLKSPFLTDLAFGALRKSNGLYRRSLILNVFFALGVQSVADWLTPAELAKRITDPDFLDQKVIGKNIATAWKNDSQANNMLVIVNKDRILKLRKILRTEGYRRQSSL